MESGKVVAMVCFGCGAPLPDDLKCAYCGMRHTWLNWVPCGEMGLVVDDEYGEIHLYDDIYSDGLYDGLYEVFGPGYPWCYPGYYFHPDYFY
jgi:hypothetical protein